MSLGGRALAPLACAVPAVLLSGCNAPYVEPFFNPYHNVSGPAGTVLFVPATRLRSCTWFECGESSTKTLGTSVDALLLSRGAKGGFELRRLAAITCRVGHFDECDTANSPPQLRAGPGGPVLANRGRGPDAGTVAWSGMRGFELTATTWLCAAAAMPPTGEFTPLKISPTPDMSRALQAVYALRRKPQGQEAAHCISAAALPQPPGASAHLFLTDVLRDTQGRWQIAYTAMDGMNTMGPKASAIAVNDGEWRMVALPGASDVLSMPGLFDTSGQYALLGSEYAYDGWKAKLQILDRASNTATLVRVALPDPR